MVDPRFYDNRGPFTLAAICAAMGVSVPRAASGEIADLASLDGAGPKHLSFFAGGGKALDSFKRSGAGFCLVPAEEKKLKAPPGMTLLPCASVNHAFSAAAWAFYPGASVAVWQQDKPVDPKARLGKNVILGFGVVIGAGAEIGDGSKIGPGCVIAPGVTIGRDCEIGSNVTISHAHIGDKVSILPGAQIGQPGFGFASSQSGHARIPQLGRVIIQDRVEIGAGTTIDRGALSDTVIGEGSKLDNLVQVGHNAQIGRHCVLVAQTGVGGSTVIEDFVIVGGRVGIADHGHIGTGARLAGRSATVSGQTVAGGQDYGGVPAKPVREWMREVHLVNALARRKKQD